MALTITQLTTIYKNMGFLAEPNVADLAGLNSIALESLGGLPDVLAIEKVGDLVNDTTGVAALTYQFFTGSLPLQAGFFYLVNSAGNGPADDNPNDLNDPYYTGGPTSPAGINGFNQENRYYNFAINLGTGVGPGAAAFALNYGPLSFADAVQVAYETIVGTAAAAAAGINVVNAIAGIVAAQPFFTQVAQQRAGGVGVNNINVKAIMAGYIMNEVAKADVGNYGAALNQFLADLADDGNASGFNQSLTVAYPPVPVNAIFTLTSLQDFGPLFTGGAGNDTFNATNVTLTQGDQLDGGLGLHDKFSYFTTGFLPITESGFTTQGIEDFELTIDNLAGTTFDVSGVTGMLSLRDLNSSDDLTLTGLASLATLLTIEDTSAAIGNGTVNLTVNYNFIPTLPAGTAQVIDLINVSNPINGSTQTTIALNGGPPSGVENVTLNVGGNSSFSSLLNNLTSSSLTNVTVNNKVGSSAGLIMQNVGFTAATNTFNASGMTGAVQIIFGSSGTNDVVSTGGAGNDVFDYQAGFDAGDNSNGGGGSDTVLLSANNTLLSNLNGEGAANGGIASNTETAVFMSGNLAGDVVWASNLGTALTLLGLGANGLLATNTADNINGPVNTLFDISPNTGLTATLGANTVTIRELLPTLQTVVVADITQLGANGATFAFDLTGATSSQGTAGTDNVNFNVQHAGGGKQIFVNDTEATGAAANNVLDAVDVFNLRIWIDSGTQSVGVTSMGDLNTLNLFAVTAGRTLNFVGSDASTASLNNINAISLNGISTSNINYNALTVFLGGITLTSGSGNDTIGDVGAAGAIGVSTLNNTMDGNDTVNAGGGNDFVAGGLGSDVLNGEAGADTIYGQQGLDTITGGDGDDNIIGGFQADTMDGGAGADTFTYFNVDESRGVTTDTIRNFVSGVDVISVFEALVAANAMVIDPTDVIFLGNMLNSIAGDAALGGGGIVEAFFDMASHTLAIDVDGDGQIDTSTVDITIYLPDTATLQARDLQAASFLPITFTAGVVGFNTNNPNHSQEGTVTVVDQADVIRTTWAQLAGATVSGGGIDLNSKATLDILDILDAVTGPTNPIDMGTFGGSYIASVSNIDRINFRGGTTVTVILPDIDIDPLTANLGASGIITTGTAPIFGQIVNGSNENDTITLTNNLDVAHGRGGDDVVNITAGGFNGIVTGNTGADVITVGAGVVFGAAANLDGGAQFSNDTLNLLDEANISAGTVGNFQVVHIDDDATMSRDQHNALQTLFTLDFADNNTLTIVGGGTLTTQDPAGPEVIETYIFADAAGAAVFVNDVTLGDDDTSVFLGDGSDILRTNGITNPLFGKTYDGGTGDTDTFQVTVANIDLTLSTDDIVTNFEVLGLDNGRSITLNNAQHNNFTSASGIGTNTVTVTDTGGFTGTTFNTIENYVLTSPAANHSYNIGGSSQTVTDNDTAGTNTVTILGGLTSVSFIDAGGTAYTVNALLGGTNISIDLDNVTAGADTVNINGTFSNLDIFMGSVSDEDVNFGAATVITIGAGSTIQGTGFSDQINVANGANLGGLQYLGGFEELDLASAGSFTLSESLWEAFVDVTNGAEIAGQDVIAPSTGTGETVTFASTLTTTALTNTAGSTVENYVLGSTGNDSITFFLNSFLDLDFDLSMSGGGQDTVRLVNVHQDNVATTASANLDIASFTAGAGGDIVNWDDDGVNLGQTFFSAVANSQSNFTGSNGAIIEITTASVNVAGSDDTSVDGNVEGVISAAIGNASFGTLAIGDNIGVILYDANGNAYLYSVQIEAGAVLTELDSTDFSVELVGTLAGVGVDALSGANFI